MEVNPGKQVDEHLHFLRIKIAGSTVFSLKIRDMCHFSTWTTSDEARESVLPGEDCLYPEYGHVQAYAGAANERSQISQNVQGEMLEKKTTFTRK